MDQSTELHADKSDELTALIDFVEELDSVLTQCIILSCVGDLALLGEGIKIGISNLDSDARGKPIRSSQFETEFDAHVDEHITDHLEIEGVFAECAFFRERFGFAVWDDWGIVDGIGFFPQLATRFSKFPFEESGRDFA